MISEKIEKDGSEGMREYTDPNSNPNPSSDESRLKLSTHHWRDLRESHERTSQLMRYEFAFTALI